jgi:putative ABC transport system substrate-binding protein
MLLAARRAALTRIKSCGRALHDDLGQIKTAHASLGIGVRARGSTVGFWRQPANPRRQSHVAGSREGASHRTQAGSPVVVAGWRCCALASAVAVHVAMPLARLTSETPYVDRCLLRRDSTVVLGAATKDGNRPQPVVAHCPPKRPLTGSGRSGGVTCRRGSSPAAGCGTVEFYSRRNASVMDRRTFIGAVTAGIITAPLAASAQTATTVRRIGVLSFAAPTTPAEHQQIYAPFRELGWIEGQNLFIERRYASGRAELLRPFAEELVRLKVELIATFGTAATLAAKDATTTIPIVIISAGDPVRSGLVASLARPGGNITGFSIVGPEIDVKRLTLLRELLPGLQRVGVLEHSTNPLWRAVRKEFEQTCRSLGLQPIIIEVAAAGELENAIAEMARRRAQALFVRGDSLFENNRVPLMSTALRYALPTIGTSREILEAGALVFYAPNEAELNQRYAAFVDRILRGAKPADLPMEQPTKFELGINLKTAKALGLAIPQSVLLRADEVIQ